MAQPISINVVVNTAQATQAIGSFQQSAAQAFTAISATATTSLNQVEKATKSMSNSFLSAAKVSLTFLAVSKAVEAVSAAFSAAVKDVVGFDKAMREVSSIAPEVRDNFTKFRQAIIDLPASLGTTTELAKGLYEAFSSGVVPNNDANKALQFTATAAELAKAGLTTVATSTKILSTSLNAYSADISEANHFSDILFKTVELGQFRFEELANALGPVLPIAKNLGVSFADTSAALATLSQAGFSASNGATALRGIYVALIQESTKFRALGIDITATLGQQGLLGLFKQMAEATGENREKIKALIPETRGLSAFLSLTGQEAAKVAKNFTDANNASGNMKVAFNENQKSIAAGVDRVGAEFDRLIQTLTGEGGVSLINTALNAVSTVLFTLRTDVIAFGALGSVVAVFQLAFGGIELAVGAVSYAIGGLVDGIGVFLKSFPGLREFGKGLEETAAIIKGTSVEILKSGSANIQAFENLTVKIQDFGKAAVDTSTKVVEAAKPQKTAMDELVHSMGNAGSAAIQLDQGLVQAGASSASAAASHKTHSESLDLLAKRIVVGVDSVGNLATKFFDAAEKGSTFKSRLEEAGASVIGLADKSKISVEDITNLVGKFTDATVKTVELRQRMADAGVTQELLNASTKGLSTAFVRLAVDKGLNIEKIVEMNTEYQGLKQQLEDSSSELKKLGVNTGDLSQKIVNLTVNNAALKGSLLTTDQAFQAISGKTLTDFLAKTELSVKAIQVLKEKGKLSPEFLLDHVKKCIKEFEDLGIKAPASLIKLRGELERANPPILTLTQSAEKLGAKFDKDVKKGLQTSVDAFNDLQASGEISTTELAKQAKKIVDSYTEAGLQVPQGLLAGFRTIVTSAEDTAKSIDNSLGAVVENVAVRAKTALQSLNDQLAGFVSTQQFGSDLTTLTDQFAKATKELSNVKDIPGATGFADYTRKNLQKELDAIQAKMKDVFLSAIQEAKSLAETTGQVNLPASLGKAAYQLGYDFEKIRKEIEASIKSASTLGNTLATTVTDSNIQTALKDELNGAQKAVLSVARSLLSQVADLPEAQKLIDSVVEAAKSGANAGELLSVLDKAKKLIPEFVKLQGTLASAAKVQSEGFAEAQTLRVTAANQAVVQAKSDLDKAKAANLASVTKETTDALAAAASDYLKAEKSLAEALKKQDVEFPGEVTESYRDAKVAVEGITKEFEDLIKSIKTVQDFGSLSDLLKPPSNTKTPVNGATPITRPLNGVTRGNIDKEGNTLTMGTQLTAIFGNLVNATEHAADDFWNFGRVALDSTLTQLGAVTNPVNETTTIGNRPTVGAPSVGGGKGGGGGGGGTLGGAQLLGGSIAGGPVKDNGVGSGNFDNGVGLPRFANGTMYSNSNQRVTLEAGEAVLNRSQAENYRSGGRDNVSFSTGITYRDEGSAMEHSGFTYVPGHGNVPNFKLSAATGRLDRLMGPNAQRELQRSVIPVVTRAIQNRDLTRPITKATGLNRKGNPTLGGS